MKPILHMSLALLLNHMHARTPCGCSLMLESAVSRIICLHLPPSAPLSSYSQGICERFINCVRLGGGQGNMSRRRAILTYERATHMSHAINNMSHMTRAIRTYQPPKQHTTRKGVHACR